MLDMATLSQELELVPIVALEEIQRVAKRMAAADRAASLVRVPGVNAPLSPSFCTLFFALLWGDNDILRRLCAGEYAPPAFRGLLSATEMRAFAFSAARMSAAHAREIESVLVGIRDQSRAISGELANGTYTSTVESCTANALVSHVVVLTRARVLYWLNAPRSRPIRCPGARLATAEQRGTCIAILRTAHQALVTRHAVPQRATRQRDDWCSQRHLFHVVEEDMTFLNGAMCAQFGRLHVVSAVRLRLRYDRPRGNLRAGDTFWTDGVLDNHLHGSAQQHGFIDGIFKANMWIVTDIDLASGFRLKFDIDSNGGMRPNFSSLDCDQSAARCVACGPVPETLPSIEKVIAATVAGFHADELVRRAPAARLAGASLEHAMVLAGEDMNTGDIVRLAARDARALVSARDALAEKLERGLRESAPRANGLSEEQHDRTVGAFVDSLLIWLELQLLSTPVNAAGESPVQVVGASPSLALAEAAIYIRSASRHDAALRLAATTRAQERTAQLERRGRYLASERYAVLVAAVMMAVLLVCATTTHELCSESTLLRMPGCIAGPLLTALDVLPDALAGLLRWLVTAASMLVFGAKTWVYFDRPCSPAAFRAHVATPLLKHLFTPVALAQQVCDD